jgi:hypothetical protein
MDSILIERRQETADSRQQTADSRQETADSRQQTADSRQQSHHSRWVFGGSWLLKLYSTRCLPPLYLKPAINSDDSENDDNEVSDDRLPGVPVTAKSTREKCHKSLIAV